MKRYVVEKDFEYKGYKCSVILQIMGHRCGYVCIPSDDKYCNVFYTEIPVYVHGGLTYGKTELVEHDDKGYWIGWDYAHYRDGKDYVSLYEKFKDDSESIAYIERMKKVDDEFNNVGYIYSQEDVEIDCKDVIDQLIELKGEN